MLILAVLVVSNTLMKYLEKELPLKRSPLGY